MKRFILTTFSLYLVLALIVSAIHILFEYKNIHDQIRGDLQSIYISASESLADDMWSMNPEQIINTINGLEKLNFVTGIEVAGDIESLHFTLGNVETQNTLSYEGPIYYTGDDDTRLLGILRLYSEQSIIYERIRVNVLFIVFNAFLKTFFLSLVMLWVGSKIIGKPLESLLYSVRHLDVDDVESIEESKVPAEATKARKENEMTEFISAYNRTLERLLTRTKQRDEDKATLENRNYGLERLVDEKTLALQEKIKELNIANENLKSLASTDYLTDILNRRSFFERVEIELSRLKRMERNAAILIIDIDHFKSVNDRFGHLAGDALLVVIAKILKNNVRQHDLVARFGGEEFSVFLIDIDVDGAVAIAERMRKNIEKQKVIFKGEVIKATASIGLSMVSPDYKDVNSVLDAADKRLYEAKEAGRNTLKY